MAWASWIDSNKAYLLSLLFFLVGTIGIVKVNLKYAQIFEKAAQNNPEAAAKEAGITFVSGHFLAFFLLPFAVVVGAALAIVGKLDAGASAIIGMVVGYIANKVVIR